MHIDDPILEDLRHEVRDFLTESIARGQFAPAVDAWLTGWDAGFSRLLAERGWIGMTIPAAYGGHGRSFLERFVVTEELLAIGAPVAAHWVADRQAAPSLLAFGTESQRHKFLPGIATGDISWAIGMSEPESGSDLASVRTRAVQVEGGWRISGTKLWTSGAHHATALFALARTSALDPDRRHAGLSQFIVLLDSPGVEVQPILTMAGDHHFNEVLLDDVFIPDDMVLGTIGDGWRQVTSELGFERSGPERFMSTFPLLAAACDQIASDAVPPDSSFGQMMGRLFGLHHMSQQVAVQLSGGLNADLDASIVKHVGTRTEGDIVEVVDSVWTSQATTSPAFDSLLTSGLMQRPGFTLRGGTSEVLRGVISRGLGMR
ncbi:acyl-CoA dehydrogenase family protein [Williamsia muralis]|uniref:Acyl-CoA dehydrogenase n=1 Tax=Williamsia marianensis TaxID=85044 RepID=A0A2G3PK18_WILMA|nr:acyl-CoA dehydrogenase family protein [Williamsia marianensis]PHV66167.1 acyl-CoA dehydrogenase [Williamsia marianensis]